MKNLLIILFLIIGVNSFSQSGYIQRNSREKIIAQIVDSGLHVPRYNGTPSGVRSGVWVGSGGIAIDTINHRFYIYSGGSWRRLAGFSEIVAATDTSTMLGNYIRDGYNGITKDGQSLRLGGNVTRSTTYLTGDYTNDFIIERFKTIQLLSDKNSGLEWNLRMYFSGQNGIAEWTTTGTTKEAGILMRQDSASDQVPQVRLFSGVVPDQSKNAPILTGIRVRPLEVLFGLSGAVGSNFKIVGMNTTTDTTNYKPTVWNSTDSTWKKFNSWGEIGLGSTPTLQDTYVGFGSDVNTLKGNVGFRFDTTTNIVTIDGNRGGGFDANLDLRAGNSFNNFISFYNNNVFKGFIGTPGAGAGSAAANDVVIQSNSQKIVLSTAGSLVGKIIVDPSSGVLMNSRFHAKQGSDVASVAGATSMNDEGNVFEITGTNAITLISNVNWQNGSEITLWFASTASLVDGTSNSGTDIGIEMGDNSNYTGSAGSSITLVLSEIGGTQRWREKCRNAGGGSGSGTVTDMIFTDGNGFDGTVTNSTTTPTLALNLQRGFESWYQYYVDMSSTGNGGLYPVTSGAGSAITNFSTTAIPDGWMYGRSLETGTTTTGLACHYGAASAGTYGVISISSSFRYNYGETVRLEDLSDGTETYNYYAGFIDDITGGANVVDGIFFNYSHSLSSGQWQCITRSNGTSTTTASGVTVAADTDYKLEVSVYNGEAKFYINGTLVATNSTNIPTGSTRNTTIGNCIAKSAGTTNRKAYIEWIAFGKRSN